MCRGVKKAAAALLAEERIEVPDRSDRRHPAEALGREVLPHVAGQGVGRERPARVGLDQGHRDPVVGREVVQPPEIFLLDRGERPGEVLRVAQPAARVVIPELAQLRELLHLGEALRRLDARVADDAVLREHLPAARQPGRVDVPQAIRRRGGRRRCGSAGRRRHRAASRRLTPVRRASSPRPAASPASP